MMKKYVLLVLSLTLHPFSVCHAQDTTSPVILDLDDLYEARHVTGCFALLDVGGDSYYFYRPQALYEAYTPASTFKICNTLIGLETGVISGLDFSLPWDGIERPVASWNKDQDLRSAFRNSAVWYYQEVARRIGGAQMKAWLDRIQYGNADTSGGIDSFWLSGGLRITPLQQVDFLYRLYLNRLPCSPRTLGIVRDIMLDDEEEGYRLSGKTGWGEQDGKDIGWYAGYLEIGQETWIFVNCIQSEESDMPGFSAARKEITLETLRRMRLIR